MLEIPKYSRADSLLRRIQILPQYKAIRAFTNHEIVATVGRRNKAKQSFLLSSTELFGKRRQQLERSIQRRSALGVENFSTPQARFREAYCEIPHESRKTCEMSNAKLFKRCSTMSKHSDDETDDFSLLTNLISFRTLKLTIPNTFRGSGNCT